MHTDPLAFPLAPDFTPASSSIPKDPNRGKRLFGRLMLPTVVSFDLEAPHRTDALPHTVLELCDLGFPLSPLPLSSPKSEDEEPQKSSFSGVLKRPLLGRENYPNSVGDKRQAVISNDEKVGRPIKKTYLNNEIIDTESGPQSVSFFNYQGGKHPLVATKSGRLSGQNHLVRLFANPTDSIEIVHTNGRKEKVSLGSIVLKVLNPSARITQEYNKELADENGLKSLDRDDIAGYLAVEKVGIPHVRCYSRPPELIGQKGGAIWILEKLDAEVKPLLDAIVQATIPLDNLPTSNLVLIDYATLLASLPASSRALIKYAKKWIGEIARKAAATGEELIGDFRPSNVMIRYLYSPEGEQTGEEFVVVDFAKPKDQLSVGDFIKCIKQWAGKGHRSATTASSTTSSSSSSSSSGASISAMPVPDLAEAIFENQLIYNYLIDADDIDGMGGTLEDYLERKREFPYLASALLKKDAFTKCTDINKMSNLEKALLGHFKGWVKEATECLGANGRIIELDPSNIAVRILYNAKGDTLGYECFERDPTRAKNFLCGKDLNGRINTWLAHNPVIRDYCMQDSPVSDD